MVRSAVAVVWFFVQAAAAQQVGAADDPAAAGQAPLPWHPDGLVAVLGDDQGRMWDTAAGGLDVRPDGRQVATGSISGAIYIWDAQTLRLERLLHAHDGPVTSLQYSADGLSLTSIGGDSIVRVWDLSNPDAEGLPITKLRERNLGVAWSADGGTIVFDGGSQTNTSVWRRTGRDNWSVAARIPPERQRFVQIPEDIQELAPVLGAQAMMVYGGSALAVSTDGALFARASGGGTIITETPAGPVSSFSSSTVTVWRIRGEDPERLWTFEGVGAVGSLAFSRDGDLIAIGTHDGKVRTFYIGGEQVEVRHELTAGGPIRGLCFNPSGQTLAVAANAVKLWKISAHDATPGWEAPITSAFAGGGEMAFGSEGAVLLYRDGPLLRRWEVDRPYPAVAADAQKRITTVHSLGFFADGTRLVAAIERGGRNEIACWKFPSLAPIPHLRADLGERRLDDITVSPDGRRFVISVYSHPQYTLELWERTDAELGQLDVADLGTGHPGSFWCTAFHPDGGTLASGHRDGTIRLWDVTGDRLRPLRIFTKANAGGVGGLDYSPAGESLASVDWGGAVHVWKIVAGLPAKPRAGQHNSRAYTVRFSPDGRLVASGDFEGQIKLWQVGAVPPAAADLAAHTANVTSLDFAPDGLALLSSGSDGRIILWDVSEKEPLQSWRFPGHVTARFDPTGQYIVSANGNGTIYVWRP